MTHTPSCPPSNLLVIIIDPPTAHDVLNLAAISNATSSQESTPPSVMPADHSIDGSIGDLADEPKVVENGWLKVVSAPVHGLTGCGLRPVSERGDGGGMPRWQRTSWTSVLRLTAVLTAASILIVLASGSALWLVEGDRPDSTLRSWGDALWWSLSTMVSDSAAVATRAVARSSSTRVSQVATDHGEGEHARWATPRTR